MSNWSIAFVTWMTLNAALPAVLLARRSRPRLQHRLSQWLIGDQKSDRSRRMARSLILAHRHQR